MSIGPSLGLPGLATGIDYTSIIQKIMAFESQPLVRLQAQEAQMQQIKTDWTTLNGLFSSLQSAANTLRTTSTYTAQTATSSDATSVTATLTGTVAAGTYNVTVQSLAQAQELQSDNWWGTNTTGSLDMNAGTFSINGVSVTVAANASLNDIATAINGANTGATAQIINNRLVLTDNKTGAANTMTFTDSGSSVYVNSSNTAVATATATTSAVYGNHALSVTQLAAGQVNDGTKLAGSAAVSSSVPTGSNSYTLTINGVTKTLTENVTSGMTNDTLLRDMASQINGAGVGVTASVQSDASGNEWLHLVGPTGSTQGFTLADATGSSVVSYTGANTVTSTAKDAQFAVDGTAYTRSSNTVSDVLTGVTLNLAGVGSTNLEVRNTGILKTLGILDNAGNVKNVVQAAQDAKFTVNGIAGTASTNTVTTAVNGMTLNLLKIVASPGVAITVKTDSSGISSKIQTFVNAYNSLITKINNLTAKGADLQGEFGLISLEQWLGQTAMDPVAGLPKTLAELSQIGISVQKDGTLAVDSTKLNDQIAANPSGVGALFSSSNGVATQVYNRMDTYTKTGGIIPSLQSGLDDTIKMLQDQESSMQSYLQLRQAALTAQFQAMEQAIQALQAQGNWLTAQLNSLPSLQTSPSKP